jgi:aromatic-L-amino-acid decarboxylase
VDDTVEPAHRDIDPAAFLERFGWHPEPELIGYRHEPTARAALESLGAATWTAALDYLYEIANRRAMGDPGNYPDFRRGLFGPTGGPAPAPVQGKPAADVIAEFRERLAGRQMNSQHPRQFGYFTPPPLPMSMMGELLAQVVNQGVDIWHAGPSAALVEEEVGRWLCDLVGYGPDSFGILTSGGTMANVMGIALARDVHLPRLRGLAGPPRGAQLEDVRVYVSDQTHFSVGRAIDKLGFPAATLAVVQSDERFRLRAEAVAEAIARDRAAGLLPLAIAAAAGSTNTGSVDAIDELADLADREGLWFHVDAAYGGAARLSRRFTSRLGSLERADSVTVDPHKWFFQAYDIGGLVVRDGAHLAIAFDNRRPEYLKGGMHAEDEPLDFYTIGIEGSRRWRGLKLWMTWKHLGTEGLARLVEITCDLASHLAQRCAEADDFETLPPEPDLSVVCFRHLPGGAAAAHALPSAELDAHQDRLQAALEVSGEGWLTTTRLGGATWLRAGIVNYLATEADIDVLLDDLRRRV